MFSHSIEREPLGVSDHSFRKCALQVRPSHKKKKFLAPKPFTNIVFLAIQAFP